MHGYYGNMGDGFFGIGRYGTGGFIMLIIGIIIIGAIIYFALRKGSGFSSAGLESPLETLQKRYINGEISQEEFLEKKEVLGKIK